MIFNVKELVDAFETASLASRGDIQALLDKASGKIYFHAPDDDSGCWDALPEDADNAEKYLLLPHKDELVYEKTLIFRFVGQHCPAQQVEEVEAIFRRKGAYGNYRRFLDRNGLLDHWYAFRDAHIQAAFLAWCQDNGLKFNG